MIAVFDFALHPASKRFTKDGIGDIDEPLARHLVHITVFREVVVDSRVLPCLCKDTFDAEVLILGAVQILDCITLDTTGD